MMTDTKLGTPIQRYSTVNKLIMSTYNISCLEIRYQSMVYEMRQTGWNTPAAMGGMCSGGGGGGWSGEHRVYWCH